MKLPARTKCDGCDVITEKPQPRGWCRFRYYRIADDEGNTESEDVEFCPACWSMVADLVHVRQA